MCKQRANVPTDPAIATIKIAGMPFKTAATQYAIVRDICVSICVSCIVYLCICRRLSPEQEAVILLLNIPTRRG
jgi:hypothetical protein